MNPAAIQAKLRKRNRKAIFGALSCMFLGAVLTLLVNMLALRGPHLFILPFGDVQNVSDRTREILTDSQGTIRATCMIPADSPAFRQSGRLLRSLARASSGVMGAAFEIEYVDPRRNPAGAARLAALGADSNGILFERGNRHVFVDLADLVTEAGKGSVFEGGARRRSVMGRFLGEAACAAAIARLARPEGGRICWLTGHSEAPLTDSDPIGGYSRILREMQREGFTVSPLNLIEARGVPESCDVLLVLGPRYPLTVDERAWLDDYLNRGGRLLFTLPPTGDAGLSRLLNLWGISPTSRLALSTKTIAGAESLATRYADHPVTRNFASATLLFGAARTVEPASADDLAGDDRLQVTPLVSIATAEGDRPVAIASERGGQVAADLAYRPGRLIVVGETAFVSNNILAGRTTANRDFFLNCVQWLAGIDAGRSLSRGADRMLATAMTHDRWVALLAAAALGLPAFALLAITLLGRRRLLP